jgi:bis(5'-adenosyl)-triphosphatase
MSSFVFGQVRPAMTQVFHSTAFTRGVVNLKPVVPGKEEGYFSHFTGHVLVIPKRCTLKFSELTPEEVADLWLTAQRIGTVIERHYNASSLTFALQDGPDAGQTIYHVHVSY